MNQILKINKMIGANTSPRSHKKIPLFLIETSMESHNYPAKSPTLMDLPSISFLYKSKGAIMLRKEARIKFRNKNLIILNESHIPASRSHTLTVTLIPTKITQKLKIMQPELNN